MAGSSAVIFLITAVLISFLDIQPLVLLLVATLPLSWKLALGGGGVQVIFPGEMLEGLLFCVYILRYFTGRQKINPGFFRHPLTISVLCVLLFSYVSLFFSSMPVVSLKSVLVKTVYIGVYYFLLYEMLKSDPAKTLKLFTWYGISLSAVVIFALVNHAGYGFSKDTSGIVALPFYADHTIYSACIAFVLPAFVLVAVQGAVFNMRTAARIFFMLVTLLLISGIFFSLCRATWVSLAFGVVFWFLLLARIRPVFLFSGFAVVAILIYLNAGVLIGSFRQNHYDSNARGAGLEEQTKSITNISNDQSNGERLNRWKCALRMFAKRPVYGYGPGTYQFKYLSFQKKSDMTRISVTNPYNIQVGHGGTAHSEYLLALSEGGIMVFIPFAGMVLLAISTAMKNIYRAADKRIKLLSGALLVGLVTYLVHGFFNNFLDTDKAAFLFWASICMITTTDLYLKNENRQNF